MDPNLFHVDWERLVEVLAAIIVLAFLLERGLAVLFESRAFVNSRMDRSVGKEAIALAVACAVCIAWKFDAVSMIILAERVTFPGELITGAVIAGGSKASIKLFRDVMGVKSSAIAEKEAAKAAPTRSVVVVAEESIQPPRARPGARARAAAAEVIEP